MNDVDLKEYFLRMLNDHERVIEERFKALALALEKAEETLIAKLTEMNQFRGQILEERDTFARKENLDSVLRGLEERLIARSKEVDARIQAQVDANNKQLEVLKEELKELQNFKSNLAGKLTIIGAVIVLLTTLVNVLL